MAASTRAITPTPTGPFSVPNRTSTPNSHAATFGTHLTKSPRGLSPRQSPQPLTGAAALDDQRRQQNQLLRGSSPNPAHTVLQSLVGTAQSAVNSHNTKDAPAHMSGPIEKAQKALVIPEAGGMTGDNMQTSPVSLSSFGSNESNHAPNAPAMEGTAPQINMEGAPHHQQPPPQQHHQHIAPNPSEHPGNRAFTFPGPLQPELDPRAPTRQMSLPGYQNSPKSPSAKRHKCPYCSTDFTRHHNLKSHLLTHSQEKPYECPTCQARFRRLHDLKRHTKLHTGERPHTCPKCGRRFARGDALARHNKGQGGCAGRRSSFGMDNDDMADGKGDESMDGVIYHGGEHDGEGDEDDDGRRVSEPARKRQNTGNSTQGPYRQHSSTYPPLAANRAQYGGNNLYPPGPGGPSGNQSTNMSPKLAPGSLSNLHYTASQANMFSQGGPPMTESPKPLSPGQQDQHRLGGHDGSMAGSRSPNIHPNYQRARGSPSMGMAPPQANNGPHLPALPGLTPSMLPKQGSQGAKNGPSMLQHQQVPGSHSQPGSGSSHGQSSGGSSREIMGNNQGIDLLQYVRDMEARMVKMSQDHDSKMTSLQTEVTTLRAQLAQQHAQNTQQQ